MAVIKPTVGRVVWYWLAKASPQRQPLAAIVASVKSDTLVNLSVIDAEGNQRGEIDVPLIQDGHERPSTHFCEWMPYQKGQAAKTEEIIKASATSQQASPFSEAATPVT
jgi:hypothetical protein